MFFCSPQEPGPHINPIPLNTDTHLETHIPVRQFILQLFRQIDFLGGVERMPQNFLNQYETN